MPVGNLTTLGLNHATVADIDIIRRATYIYALYRTMCTLNHGEASSAREVYDMMCQYARQANDTDSAAPLEESDGEEISR